jgi:hypothetical protein
MHLYYLLTCFPVGLKIEQSPFEGGKRSRQLSGEQGDDQMSIDFAQIINIWFKPGSYHPQLPPSKGDTFQNYLDR